MKEWAPDDEEAQNLTIFGKMLRVRQGAPNISEWFGRRRNPPKRGLQGTNPPGRGLWGMSPLLARPPNTTSSVQPAHQPSTPSARQGGTSCIRQ